MFGLASAEPPGGGAGVPGRASRAGRPRLRWLRKRTALALRNFAP